jgi:hypothetical protein
MPSSLLSQLRSRDLFEAAISMKKPGSFPGHCSSPRALVPVLVAGARRLRRLCIIATTARMAVRPPRPRRNRSPVRAREQFPAKWKPVRVAKLRQDKNVERFPTGWSHPVDKKSLEIRKLEHILVARIEWIRAEYALKPPAGLRAVPQKGS